MTLPIFSTNTSICILMNQERFWNESSLKQELQIILQDTRVILQDNIKYTATHFVTKIQCLLYINNVQFIIET